MSAHIFTPADLRQMEERGVSVDVALEQIRTLRNPPSAIRLLRPCTVGDGIEHLSDERDQESAGRAAAEAGRVIKFVPASGAASRMFKDLIAALDDSSARPSQRAAARELFTRLDEFPFAAELRQRAAIGVEPETEDQERRVLHALIHEMGYGSRPKALIPFHRNADGVRTAFEEHLFETCRLVGPRGTVARVHYTIPSDSLDDFKAALAAVEDRLRARNCNLDVTFSFQHPSTDTVAIDHKGSPFRSSEGTLLFRPGGHGALIRNLQDLRADIVVIKNIDNIVPEAASDDVVRWKHILVGCLVALQRETFRMLASAGEESSHLDDAIEFARSRFGRAATAPLATSADKRQFVKEALDRPIRVCGVVRNEGEPGGAPFWTADANGESIQIVESSQVDFADAEQSRIWNSSTHFNPVDIVCGMLDRTGKPFDLARFVEHRAVFVSKKSHEGRELYALELPGLWNGAMAGWNTVCVEVPASTFAPVKTVFDLLRPQHQVR